MMLEIHFLLLVAGIVLFASVIFAKLTSKIGVPVLIVFLFLGLLLDTRSFVEESVSNYTLVQHIHR